MESPAIVANNLNKIYNIYTRPWEKYLNFFLPMDFGARFHAIQGVSFSLERGRSIGLLGLNGSGKSTLANMIAGASSPTSGTLQIDGQVAMTAVSSGLSTLLTGRENIMQKCLLLGLSRRRILELMPGDHRVFRAGGRHRPAGQDLLQRYALQAWFCHFHQH